MSSSDDRHKMVAFPLVDISIEHAWVDMVSRGAVGSTQYRL